MVTRFVRDTELEAWLVKVWDGGFEWDHGNTWKPEKHGVTPSDVEHFFSIGPSRIQGQIVPPDMATWPKEERRYLTLGLMPNGKAFAIIWTTRGRKIRFVSCRRMRDGERERFEDTT